MPSLIAATLCLTMLGAGEETPTPKLKTLLRQSGTHESATAEEPRDQVKTPATIAEFLEATCSDCHGYGGEEGGFAIESLGWSLADETTHDHWVRLLDRVATGEMPPADYDQPSAADRAAFVASLRPPLIKSDELRHASQGRSRIRRLNRSEYETALSDVLHAPLRIAELLPEDARKHGFDTVGEALNLSSVQMESYLAAVDVALDAATTLVPQPETEAFRLRLQEMNSFMQVYRRGGPFRVEEDGVALFARELFSHYNGCVEHWTAPRDGRYRITVSAYGVQTDEPIVLTVRAGGNGHSESQHVPSVILDHFVVRPGGKDAPQELTWEGNLLRGHFLHIAPTSLRPMRFGNNIVQKLAYKGPGVLVRHIDVEGPILDPVPGDLRSAGPAGEAANDVWPPASHRILWGGIGLEPIENAKPIKSPNEHLTKPPSKIAKPKTATLKKKNIASGERFVYNGPITINGYKIGGEPIHRSAPRLDKPLDARFRLVTDTPHEDAERLVRRFVPRAFRLAPDAVTEEDVAPFVALAHAWLDEGASFEESMRTAYKAILCSPKFLYRRDSLPTATSDGGTLSTEALRERLAFFLWNGPPDESLAELDLSNPIVRRQAASRMLDDPRSERFLTHLLDEWFDLRLIDFTSPDSALYPEHDALLQWSMLEETRGYIAEMLAADRPAAELVASDWTMLNWRLLDHYGLAGRVDDAPLSEQDGMAVRKVSLPADSVRGGVLTQASILKVTANGTTTSPVIRGVWILDRIIGQPPSPPPPGVPAVEPDIRGAVTIREQIEKHRESAACASCHANIDPPGLALESFDVIGQYRQTYRKLNPEYEDLQPKFGPTPQPLRWQDGLPVDASGQTADARAFGDVNEYKRLLLDDRRQLARSVVEKFVVYSTGAAPSIADRDEIETILDAAEPSNYGLRSLLLAVVESPLFVRK